MKIWLAYVNYPITTAVYLKRALQGMGHTVTTIGPKLPEEAITLWQLENMKLPLDPLDIDTSFNPDMGLIWDSTPVAQRPDLYLWVESVNSYTPENLARLDCPKACWLIDTHYHLPAALATARQFDYVFIAQLIDLEAFRESYPHTYWLPLACDPEIHGRQDTVQQHDISFVGSMNQRRAALLEHLSRHFHVHQERSFWTDMSRAFSASKIVLNDASFDDLNMRFFEALCSGSLLLSNPTSGSGQDILFHDGEEYACHHDHDLTDIAHTYLADEQLRHKVASEGRKRVLTAHTYRHRAEDLLQVALHGKSDTFSPQELRQRSEESYAMDFTTTPRIRSIVTTRNKTNWPTWQMVHEWEDILARILAVPLRQIGEPLMLPDRSCLPENYDLIFLQLASELRYYSGNTQLIPIVMDLWRENFAEFVQQAPCFKLVFVTNLQAFRELSSLVPNLRHLPFSLADQYLNCSSTTKDFDIIQYGRRNPLLDKFMACLLEKHPDIHYVTTEAFEDEKKVRLYSNKLGCIGESDSRSRFMDIVSRSRISLVSTVGMDDSRDTGGIDPVSPRFIESLAAGCHLVGRIPDNEEFATTGIGRLCHHVETYPQFESTVLTLLHQKNTVLNQGQNILPERLTSTLPARILDELYSIHGIVRTPITTGELMQNARPATDLSRRLGTLRQLAGSIAPDLAFSNYQTLCDVIASYSEFHQLDLSDFYTTIITDQSTTDAALLFAALELSATGDTTAAITLVRRVRQINPSNLEAAFLHADLLRRRCCYDEARLVCLELQKLCPDSCAARAALDMCDIDEALPLAKEHYHLLGTAHQLLRPKRYLEIGVSNGKSLSLARYGTETIGVDPLTASPDQQFFHSPEVIPALFKLTSNDFFRHGCMEQTWSGQPFNMAFIDGLHLFEQALMDFAHLEQRSAPDSIIFIHDCLPVSTAGASRERNTMVWTGDVWKVIHCLKSVRPDLAITTFPVRPSGLAMIRRLDSSSRLLSTQFDAVVHHFMEARLPEDMDERFKLLNVTDMPFTTVLSDIAPFQQQPSMDVQA